MKQLQPISFRGNLLEAPKAAEKKGLLWSPDLLPSDRGGLSQGYRFFSFKCRRRMAPPFVCPVSCIMPNVSPLWFFVARSWIQADPWRSEKHGWLIGGLKYAWSPQCECGKGVPGRLNAMW